MSEIIGVDEIAYKGSVEWVLKMQLWGMPSFKEQAYKGVWEMENHGVDITENRDEKPQKGVMKSSARESSGKMKIDFFFFKCLC